MGFGGRRFGRGGGRGPCVRQPSIPDPQSLTPEGTHNEKASLHCSRVGRAFDGGILVLGTEPVHRLHLPCRRTTGHDLPHPIGRTGAHSCFGSGRERGGGFRPVGRLLPGDEQRRARLAQAATGPVAEEGDDAQRRVGRPDGFLRVSRAHWPGRGVQAGRQGVEERAAQVGEGTGQAEADRADRAAVRGRRAHSGRLVPGRVRLCRGYGQRPTRNRGGGRSG